MLGLIPGAAAFATNLLNVPQDQNGYTLAMLVLTLALLLWTNYSGSIANAQRANVKLTGDARWDFWESGLVAMAALIVLGIMLPPLSTVDRTLDVETGIFSNWAQLQQRLSHPGFFSNGRGSGVTGFQDVLFYPGELYRIDRPTMALQVPLRSGSPTNNLFTIDRLSSVQPPSSAGNYAVTVDYSTATVTQLEQSGTTYPDWLAQYR